MKHRNLLTILRQVTETGPPATDADLLDRFVRNRDGDSFATLVRRHGRLVWNVCHHLAREDADDAFQAVFLVLLRNAAKVRNPNSLAAWLHGVAYRVCSKARQTEKRRTSREHAAAISERGGSVVPDSAWERALLAVHQELVRLPESLRVPFVLCALEGQSVTEAAERLGWKVNTVSVRLNRAKDLLLARLNVRGITAGAVATLVVTETSAPAGLLAQTFELVQGGVTISGSIHRLTQGVFGMSAFQMKMLAAGLLLTVGLGVGGRAGWIATAEAQYVTTPDVKQSPEDRVKQLELELERAKREVARKAEAERLKEAGGPVHSTTNWRYSFVPVRDMDAEAFVEFLRARESKGWDYHGQMTLKKDGKDNAVWVFRQPTAVKGTNFYGQAYPMGGVADPSGSGNGQKR
ncbi:MAG TPA: sigma-70 family RNA polymerase sigma factor [Gemmataceae bacterium]|nr:sigma-70 family RNA polymerase sigma factor [Gemmataceae bacterium]